MCVGMLATHMHKIRASIDLECCLDNLNTNLGVTLLYFIFA